MVFKPCAGSGGSAGLGGSARDPLRHKLADAELEDQVWAFLPPTARASWHSAPKRMVTSEAQVQAQTSLRERESVCVCVWRGGGGGSGAGTNISERESVRVCV